MPEPMTVPQNNELAILYQEKGEVVTQLELGQNKLMQINARLNQLLGIGIPQNR